MDTDTDKSIIDKLIFRCSFVILLLIFIISDGSPFHRERRGDIGSIHKVRPLTEIHVK